MIYSNKKLSQLIVASCVAYQVEHVIISPGSRNAPLIIGFANHPKIKAYSVVDERSAAFFALGIAQQTQKPTAIICTSGSALLNYYPAIAEAYYSNIPLVVISADRPKHLIDIGDGQTIRQEGVFKNHSLYNANLIEGIASFQENSVQITKALHASISEKGPVHINVPFDEPLYETVANKSIETPLALQVESNATVVDYSKFVSLWGTSKKKLILIGANYPDKELEQLLSKIIEDESVLVFTETISNVHHPKFINSIDKLIFLLDDNSLEELQPNILITLGGMVVSKKIKQFLRAYQPEQHWHIDTKKADNTYHCLTEHVKVDSVVFFDTILKQHKKIASSYQKNWLTVKSDRDKKHQKFIDDAAFSDLKVFDIILKHIPKQAQLQLSNSSIIRYTQLFDVNKSVQVFCNRGTSGIDGSTSTAIGASQVAQQQTVFITGDISFFYDSNALWNAYLKKDFKIILVNNGGGNIFKFIPGPSTTNALEFFETPHHLSAKQLCEMYHIEYVLVETEDALKNKLQVFFNVNNSAKLLEVNTSEMNNDTILRSYFKSLSIDS